MKAKRYEVTLTGLSPLLMHHLNLEWRAAMEQWKLDPANKKKSVPGDDRTPAWRWIGNLYVDSVLPGGKLGVCIPSDNLMTMLREGGKQCLTGKGKQTYKMMTQSGIIIDQLAWPVVTKDGRVIPWSQIAPLIEKPDYAMHEDRAKELGFELFAKSVVVGQSKHVRVRPRFDSWSAAGTLTVTEEQITPDVLKNILATAGKCSGLGDWRPSSKMAPGPYGRFLANVKEVKE